MISNKSNIANAMSGKTARACDSCVRRRASWYCAADDAFLCQVCDGTVHSANALARRHERVRLKSASLNRANQDPVHLPYWNSGSTRKARTPRHAKHYSSKSDGHCMEQNPHHVVPELGVEETTYFCSSHCEEDEQLLYRVPTYDPFVGELSNSSSSLPTTEFMIKSSQDGFQTSDLNLEEFAVDVETLLGKGLDEEAYGIDDLGLLDCSPNDESMEFMKVVKDEDELLCNGVELINKCEIEVDSDNRVPFELSFDYDHEFALRCEEHQHEEQHKVMMVDVKGNVTELCKFEGNNYDDDEKINEDVVVSNKRRKILLRLDYEAISTAWASQGSPWANGQRPDISPLDCWPHCMGINEVGMQETMFGDIQLGGRGDGEREARVSRYKEKRRKRLFSKKIRYEVRKLNAEKRPRLKGRFVKRSSFAPTTTFTVLSK